MMIEVIGAKSANIVMIIGLFRAWSLAYNYSIPWSGSLGRKGAGFGSGSFKGKNF